MLVKNTTARRIARWQLLTVGVSLLAGCYAVRPSNGDGQTEFEPPRRVDANNLALPSGYRIEAIALADHDTNQSVVGSDGMLYFGQRPATDSAVVGEDNAVKWLLAHPRHRDIPCKDINPAGESFSSGDFRSPEAGEEATTGAYMAFGTSSTPGQRVAGSLPCRRGFLIRLQVRRGFGAMPGFAVEKISDFELDDLIAHLRALRSAPAREARG